MRLIEEEKKTTTKEKEKEEIREPPLLLWKSFHTCSLFPVTHPTIEVQRKENSSQHSMNKGSAGGKRGEKSDFEKKNIEDL